MIRLEAIWWENIVQQYWSLVLSFPRLLLIYVFLITKDKVEKGQTCKLYNDFLIIVGHSFNHLDVIIHLSIIGVWFYLDRLIHPVLQKKPRKIVKR